MHREIGYLNKDNIIEKDGSNPNEIAQQRFEDRQNRSNRVGGLGYYKDRNERMEDLGQRKKHGHLENMAGNIKNMKSQSKNFIQAQVQKRQFNEMNVNLMKRNLDSLNLPK